MSISFGYAAGPNQFILALLSDNEVELIVLDTIMFNEYDIIDVAGLPFIFYNSLHSIAPPHEDDPDEYYYWETNWKSLYKIEYVFEEFEEELPYQSFVDDFSELLGKQFDRSTTLTRWISGFAYVIDHLDDHNRIHCLICVHPQINDGFTQIVSAGANSYPFHIRRLVNDASNAPIECSRFIDSLQRLTVVEGRPKALALGAIVSSFT